MILPVIMAGGSGSRLWPLSRQLFPKQFLTLHGENSMLQATALRLSGIEHQAPIVICNEEHRFSVAEQFRTNNIDNSGIILEPVGRNTAPAIALAAFEALKKGNDPLLLVLAADHVIKNEQAFCASVEQAAPYAESGKLVTFGVVPTAAETGYGYIKKGNPSTSSGRTGGVEMENPSTSSGRTVGVEMHAAHGEPVEPRQAQGSGRTDGAEMNNPSTSSGRTDGVEMHAAHGEPVEPRQAQGSEQMVLNGFDVAEFVEKPDLATAEKYLASGDYYWNSGMFLFKASCYLAELKAHRPDIYQACEKAMATTANDIDFIRVDKAAFEACPDDSVDYAVMEKTSQAVVVPMDCGWSDVGSWSALWDIEQKDSDENVLKGDVISIDSSNSYVNAQEKLVALVGLDDVVVVETKDAVLVSKKSQVQKVKNVVNQLKAEQRPEFKLHREVYRPWGKYDSVDNGERFQVKRITVKPGAKLSVQMHHHRAEHWIVVSGTAKVTNGEDEILLTENQSTYIPIGVVHALENPGKVDLELIEVQSGSYLGEDDIVRFEDKYGRVK